MPRPDWPQPAGERVAEAYRAGAGVSASAGAPAMVFVAQECWLDGWRGATAIAVDEAGFRLATEQDPAPTGVLSGTVMPGFHDSHVHLGLVDGTALPDAGIAAVDDFGWDLETVRTWRQQPGMPLVAFAGQLLTAPGGYPTESGWAPRAAVWEIAGPEEAEAAVQAQVDSGAGFIKVALNSEAGPVVDDVTLRAIVASAHSRALPVAAHTQGLGQAARALEAGVDRLAHTPWSERLPDGLVSAMAGAMTWVSTLDIHGWGDFDADFAVANDNAHRFHAAGGDIRYGTDLGNGPLPLGINHRELLALEHAGLDLDALLRALATRPAPGRFGAHLSFTPSDDRSAPADWLAGARLLSPHSVSERLS